MEPRTFIISGRVIDPKGNPVRDLRVEAWDKDKVLADDFVGQADTRGDGTFQISFDESRYQDLMMDKWPDIYFKIYRERDLIHSTEDSVLCDVKAGKCEVGDIAVNIPTAGGTPRSADGTIKGVIFYDASGDVTFQKGEEPIAGVEVKLEPTGSNKPPGPQPQTRTIGDGSFTFTVGAGEWLVKLAEEIDPDKPPPLNPPGLPKLRLSEPRLATIRVQLRARQTRDLGRIGYEAAGGFVGGTIFLDRGMPESPEKNLRLPGVRVSLVNLDKGKAVDTQTDRQGSYYFTNLETGLYLLRPEPTLPAAKFHLGEGLLRLPEPAPEAFHFSPGQEEIHDIGYIAMGGDVRGVVFLDEDGSGVRFGDEPGIQGVPVVLVEASNAGAKETVTTATGEYAFSNVSPGKYTLLFTDVFQGSSGEEFTITTQTTQQITVEAAATVQAAATGYQPEVHEIRGRVVFEDGTPVRDLVVTLCDAATGDEIDTTVTDIHGEYVFRNRQGDFTLKFPDPPFAGQLLTPKVKAVHVDSVARVPDTKYRLTSADIGGAGDGVPPSGSVQDAVTDIASYMPTSQEVGGPADRPRAPGMSAATAPLQQVLDSTLTKVLGRKLKATDAKGFQASLKRVFTLEQVEGRTAFKWTPRTYAVQTELGGELTGAQASIYHRAKAALEDALPLLDGLKPLLASPDAQEVDAVRSIVRTEFVELVDELGVEGGPRVQRVDDLFRLLRDELGRLENVFGLTGDHVITVDEEQNLTNYLVVRDYVEGLLTTWGGENGFRRRFGGNEARFLGTQLVLLSRVLSVVAESAEEAYSAMGAVFLGPAERQTVRIDFQARIRIDNREEPILTDAQGRPLQPPSMTVAELLSWVQRFATDEGPRLIQEGGRRGVAAIQPTARTLQRLVLGASQANVQHVGFSRIRVRRSLSELAAQLGQVERLARELLLEGNAARNHG